MTDSVAIEVRRVFTTPALRRSCLGIGALGILAPLANAATLTVHDSSLQTANAFTSMNAGVFLALLLGVLGTTGSARLPAGFGPVYRRAVGTKARAYGLIGAGAVLLLGVLAAVIALPILHARGVSLPSASVVSNYAQREVVAGFRLAIIGAAIGVLVGERSRAVIAMFGFLIVDAVAEQMVPLIKNYGPIGALNTFSDPSHHHQLAIAAGAGVALAWAILAVLIATLVSESRYATHPLEAGPAIQRSTQTR